jgi:hypothetical protein
VEKAVGPTNTPRGATSAGTADLLPEVVLRLSINVGCILYFVICAFPQVESNDFLTYACPMPFIPFEGGNFLTPPTPQHAR